MPDDFLDVMNVGLDKYPTYDKCGLSLEINDLPDDNEGNTIHRIESVYWEKSLDNMYFHADTDTTFAMYREGPQREYGHSAIRTNRPYTAKHLPWYYRDFKNLPEDEQYYFATALYSSSSGKSRMK